MRTLLFLAFTILLPRSFANASVVSVTQNGAVIATNLKHKWTFVEVEPGTRALFAQTLVALPGIGTVSRIEGPAIFFDPRQAKRGRFVIGLGAFETPMKIFFREGGSRNLVVKVKLDQTLLREEGCKEAGLKLLAKARPKQPIFVGIRCEKKADRTQIALTVPQEVDWDVTSLFEISGKGERWKAYEISRASIGGNKNSIAQFAFRNKQEKLEFSLALTSLDGKPITQTKPVAKLVAGRMGLGGGMLSSAGSADSASGFGPLLYGDAFTKVLIWKMKARAQLNYVLPLAKSSFYNFSFGAGPGFEFGGQERPTLITAFVEYVALGQDQTVNDTNLAYRHNQIGGSLYGRLPIGERNNVSAVASYGGFGGDSTAYGIFVHFERTMASRQSWGVGLSYLGESTKISDGGSIAFSQMLGFATYGL